MKTIITCLLSAALLAACIPVIKEKDGKFLNDIVNLEEFNSDSDDYNSNIASNKSGQTHLIFSSKRDKKNFLNLVFFPAAFTYNDRLGLEKVKQANHQHLDYYIKYFPAQRMAEMANGNFNVYGPKTLLLSQYLNSGAAKDDLFLFYADDSEGNLEIKYIRQKEEEIQKPVKFDVLNSAADDAYPTFSRTGNKIYFCSNRDGNFDIYEATLQVEPSMQITAEQLVSSEKYTIRKVKELSGSYNDKCPTIEGNRMIFVSDRPDGFGGFDIYESILTDGTWSTPANLGNRINTRYNEYRPIFADTQTFSYSVMVFSSDRPGGKGGYDLYMTGLGSENSY